VSDPGNPTMLTETGVDRQPAAAREGIFGGTPRRTAAPPQPVANHWGIELNVRRDGRLFALASDRDHGLYIYRFGPDLRSAKASSPRRTRVGNTFSYRIGARNAGTIAETATVARDRLPRGVRFVSASATQGRCSHRAARRTVVCNLGRARERRRMGVRHDP
jgi:uncharacterized repeat protein (TIGR01451 family)